MSGGEGVNQVGGGVSVHGTQPQSFDDGVEQARNPQRLNRSSIESLPGTERKVLSSTEKTKEFPPLASRKVSLLAPGKFRLLLSRPKKEVNIQDLGGIQQQNKALGKMFERQEPKKAQNKSQSDQRVKDLEDSLKWAKSNHKKAAKLAGSVTLKLSIADKTGVPAQLNPVEKETLQQLEQAKELVGKFEGKLAEAKTDKAEFKTVEKLKDSFASRLEILEKKVSEASRTVNAKFTPLSVSDHKSRVSDLEKKLTTLESALKELNQLGKNVAAAEEDHPGATPKGLGDKMQKLVDKTEAARAKGPEVLQKAKTKRDGVLEQQVAKKRAAKQAARDERDMNKAYKNLRRVDQHRDRQVQQKQEALGKRPGRSSAPEVHAKKQPQTQKSTLKKSPGLNDLPSQVSSRSKPVSRSHSHASGLSSKGNWTPEDQVLANRLKRLKGQVAHDPITSSGKVKTFAQLEKQLHSLSSVDDLKSVVADRRSSKITIDQQRRYLGFLSAAVQGMAKNSQHAEKMNEDLIRDVLKEQPSEARAAIKQMHSTHADNLQRRLDRLRDQK